MLDPVSLHRRARRVLPECLRTRAVLDVPADEDTMARWMLPLRHRHHGRLCFELEAETAMTLVRDPWSFLDHARQAREGLGRHAAPLRYEPWQQLGVAAGPVYQARSGDGRATLWLLPLRLRVIYTWNDRARHSVWLRSC